MHNAPIAATHPLVQLFLSRVAAAAPVFSQPPSTGKYQKAEWQTRDAAPSRVRSVTYWTFYMGGFARPEDFDRILGRPDLSSTMSKKEKEAVFALAALYILPFPGQPVHWAFWGRKHASYVMYMAFKICREQSKTVTPPSPLVCPEHSWAELLGYHNWYRPREVVNPLQGEREQYNRYKPPPSITAGTKRRAAEADTDAATKNTPPRAKRLKVDSVDAPPRRSPRTMNPATMESSAADAEGDADGSVVDETPLDGPSHDTDDEPIIIIVVEPEDELEPLAGATHDAIDGAATSLFVAPFAEVPDTAGTSGNKIAAKRASRPTKGAYSSHTKKAASTTDSPSPSPSPSTASLVPSAPPALPLRVSVSMSPTPTVLSLSPSESSTRVNTPIPVPARTTPELPGKLAERQNESPTPARPVRFSTRIRKQTAKVTGA